MEIKPDAPQPTNCYDIDFLCVVLHEKATPETRKEFTGDISSKLIDKGIRATAAGEEGQSLLFTSDPENADELRDLAKAYKANDSLRANMCLKGFAEAQFIVRDSEMNQTLITTIPTDVKKAWMYVVQQYGATPMK